MTTTPSEPGPDPRDRLAAVETVLVAIKTLVDDVLDNADPFEIQELNLITRNARLWAERITSGLDAENIAAHVALLERNLARLRSIRDVIESRRERSAQPDTDDNGS